MPGIDWHVYNASLMALNTVIAFAWAAASWRIARNPDAALWPTFAARPRRDPALVGWRWVVVAWLSSKGIFFAAITAALLAPLPQPIGETGLTLFTAVHAYAFYRWLLLPPAAPLPGPPPLDSFRQ